MSATGTDRWAVRSDVNDRLLDEMSERIAKVMEVTQGVMSAWTAEEVKQQLITSLMALDAHPETERTYGLVSLTRSQTNSNDYFVSLNLGTLMQFPEGRA